MLVQIFDKTDGQLSAVIDLRFSTLEDVKQWYLNTYTGCIEDIEYIKDVRSGNTYRFGDLKRAKVEQLRELMADIWDAREHSRNLGRLYNSMYDDEDGKLVVDFWVDKPLHDLDGCLVAWGKVYMTERCQTMIYDPDNEQMPLAFKFRYFYDTQQLYVRPDQLKDETLQAIIDWIYRTINY